MSKLCKQVSIESPGPSLKDCIFSFDIPVPDVPTNGARIKVIFAGACYRPRKARSASLSSASSFSSFNRSLSIEMENTGFLPSSPAHTGLKDGALFPGFEVAGIIDEFGVSAAPNNSLKKGSPVILYPYEGVPYSYASYIIVPDLKYLVPVPDSLALSVAAMLPSGALLAKNFINTARKHINKIASCADNEMVKLLIVGTGGLALWALRLAVHDLKKTDNSPKVHITVASLKDEGLMLAKECKDINVIQWNEHLYETQLIERTVDACRGHVNIVINFGITSRSLNRSMQCLEKGGVVLITEDVGEKLLPKFAKKSEEMKISVEVVPNGSIEQLTELVNLVVNGEITPPPHSVYPVEEAYEVVKKLCNSEIQGRAILKFQDHH